MLQLSVIIGILLKKRPTLQVYQWRTDACCRMYHGIPGAKFTKCGA